VRKTAQSLFRKSWSLLSSLCQIGFVEAGPHAHITTTSTTSLSLHSPHNHNHKPKKSSTQRIMGNKLSAPAEGREKHSPSQHSSMRSAIGSIRPRTSDAPTTLRRARTTPRSIDILDRASMATLSLRPPTRGLSPPRPLAATLKHRKLARTVRERRVQPNLAIWVQTPYCPLSGRASITNFEARPRGHVISETPC
jgi:hypothetical protein